MYLLRKLGELLEKAGDYLFENGGFRGKSDKEIDNDIAQLAFLLLKREKEAFTKEAKCRAKGLNVNDLPYIRLKFHKTPIYQTQTLTKMI